MTPDTTLLDAAIAVAVESHGQPHPESSYAAVGQLAAQYGIPRQEAESMAYAALDESGEWTW